MADLSGNDAHWFCFRCKTRTAEPDSWCWNGGPHAWALDDGSSVQVRRLVDDDERTWPMTDSYPVLLDDRGLVIGPMGWSHSEACARERKDADGWDPTTIAAQLAPNGDLFVLPEGDKGPNAERLLTTLRTIQSGRDRTPS